MSDEEFDLEYEATRFTEANPCTVCGKDLVTGNYECITIGCEARPHHRNCGPEHTGNFRPRNYHKIAARVD